MTIQDALDAAKIARSEAEILMAHLLEKDRSWILGHSETELDAARIIQLTDLFERRSGGEPIAYITGQKEFYGRDFVVNPFVLIPRPSTEGLIDLVLECITKPKDDLREVDAQIIVCSKVIRDATPQVIVDVGTGSGCIAITLALECPNTQIIATDISQDALDVAKANAEKHHVDSRIDFRTGDLLDPIADLDEAFFLVSNPPYIPEDEDIMSEVRDFEPSSALFGGEDGTGVVRRLIRQATAHPSCAGYVLECRKEQIES